MKIYIKSSIAPDQEYYENSLTGIAYKVFLVKDGKLYPPMVSNPGGADTPMDIWLNADMGKIVGRSKEGYLQVATASGKVKTLSFRPGWHLGDYPEATQFKRTYGWVKVLPVDYKVPKTRSLNSMSKKAGKANLGKIIYIAETDEYVKVVNNGPYFPYNFIWAKCKYTMNRDYQAEANDQGYIRHVLKNGAAVYDENGEPITKRSNKFQHSLAGLRHIPEDGYYKYRTNPDPTTVPWVITGAMKVLKLLDDSEVDSILQQYGIVPMPRQCGSMTAKELMELC